MIISRPRILLVEDDPTLRGVIADALTEAGFHVATSGDGEQAVGVADAHRPDLAVLDVMLPSRSGFDLARVLRSRSDLPVIFVTARDAVDDRLTGFDIGADDYLVKPFALAELLARVRAVLRRSGHPSGQLIEIGDLLIDEGAGVVQRAGRNVDLTATEFKLLGLFGQAAGPGAVEDSAADSGLGLRRVRPEPGGGVRLDAPTENWTSVAHG